jgi:hypothetical protein
MNLSKKTFPVILKESIVKLSNAVMEKMKHFEASKWILSE